MRSNSAHAKIGFQRVDLARQRGLAQMQAHRGPGDAAHIDDRRKGAQLTQVHAVAYNNYASIVELINALDAISAMRSSVEARHCFGGIPNGPHRYHANRSPFQL